MSERFTFDTVSREGRYALGRDGHKGTKILAIPVGNRMVDYEEHYRISADQHHLFLADQAAALAFADFCRAREKDDLLVLQPGSDRGVPR